jgi:sulfur transfer complex TusBCD TusB component (DsrH family)
MRASFHGGQGLSFLQQIFLHLLGSNHYSRYLGYINKCSKNLHVTLEDVTCRGKRKKINIRVRQIRKEEKVVILKMEQPRCDDSGM